jgi:hypothetical protein
MLPSRSILTNLLVAISYAGACGGDGSSETSKDAGHDVFAPEVMDAGVETGGARDRTGAPALPVRTVVPGDTDPAIRAGDPLHMLVDAAPPAQGLLFVLLPGTGIPPIGYRKVLQNAAAGGYDAIGLAYVNEAAVNSLCLSQPPTCPGDVRREIVTGTDTSPLVAVDRANSIEHRLVALLRHEGWTQYLDGDAPRYAAIALAGHSQGGGHAAFIAKEHDVYRAVLFAATESAAWTRAPGLTSATRYFAFMHTADSLYGFFIGSWDALGIPGPLTNIDALTPPFPSQQLETSVTPTDGNGHLAPVVDPSTPMDGDQPVYRDVWAFLVGP